MVFSGRKKSFSSLSIFLISLLAGSVLINSISRKDFSFCSLRLKIPIEKAEASSLLIFSLEEEIILRRENKYSSGSVFNKEKRQPETIDATSSSKTGTSFV